jgi:TonB dependent receptor
MDGSSSISRRFMGSRVFILLVLLAALCRGMRAQESALHITVHGQDQKPVPGATISLKVNGVAMKTAKTNQKGEALISEPSLASFQLSVSKEGFQPLSLQVSPEKDASSIDLDIALIPRLRKQETVVVKGAETTENAGTSSQEIERQQMKNVPTRPATVAEALPLFVGVVRGPEGLSIAGAGDKHNALLVNSVDSTDPGTGDFGMTLPVDAVENLSVASTPYLAQYGGFTGSVVSTATRGGGDKWHFELNDPFPEFRIRSLHLEGLKSATPHVNFGGPLLARRLFFSDATEVNIDKSPVRTLPFPFNETKTTVVNSFSQLDLVLSPSHTLTGTFHIAPQSVHFANLNFFDPQPVTPNLELTSRAVALTDRLAIGGGILQSTVAGEGFKSDVSPQARGLMFVTPVGDQGSYFNQQMRRSSRIEWIENYALKPLQFAGTHNLQLGVITAQSENNGSFIASPVIVEDASGHPLKRIDFRGGRHFSRSDLQLATFAQDHWSLTQSLAFDGGLRVEQQDITGTRRLAPRAGFVWVPPIGNKRTSIRGGSGVFYDRVPLNVYAFQDYPRQVVTNFDPAGNVLGSPVVFLNVIMASDHKWAAVHRRNRAGNFAPYSIGTSLEVEQVITPIVKVAARYSLRNSHGLVTVSPGLLRNGLNALIERDNGNSSYRELSFTTTVGRENGRRLFFSYARSSARGDLNDSNGYVGNLPFPILRSNFFSNLAGDVPNRILAWGESPLPWKFRVIPLVEFHTGFPYFVTDAQQKFVGIPNSDQTRFPNYFSIDTRLSRDFTLSPKYTARISVRGLNLTNHFNALAIHSNTGDPQFGTFFGTYKRRFRLDFDMLF